MAKPHVHFLEQYLISPTNPVTVNLIGAGGNGHLMLTALSKINFSLVALGHPGFAVQLFDPDTVTAANQGRQLYATSELGLNKAVVLISRVNRFFGTDWKAVPVAYNKQWTAGQPTGDRAANMTISCVDTVQARFEISEILQSLRPGAYYQTRRPYYWIDLGNSADTGQVILSTVGKIAQPASRKYITVGSLPFITDEFKELLVQSENEDDTPSCSIAEALDKQDLFINPAVVDIAGNLVWRLFKHRMTTVRGVFINLEHYHNSVLKVEAPAKQTKRPGPDKQLLSPRRAAA